MGPLQGLGAAGCGQRWPATQRRVHLQTCSPRLCLRLTASLSLHSRSPAVFHLCSPSTRSNANLLSVEVCLDPSKKDEPTAINCPGARADAVGEQAGVVECTGNIWMRLGIEVGGVGWVGWWWWGGP